MPSPFTSTFASAAAGSTSNEAGANGRSTGSGDWTRARTNGATQTFRRTSGATNSSQQRDGSQYNNTSTPSSTNAYVPPHMNSNHHSTYSRNGSSAESRYSKDQLLDLFRTQEGNGFSSTNINELFVDGWSPGIMNGMSNGGWGRRDDIKEAAGPDICWDHEGSVNPISLQEWTEEEKEAFSTSVNSPLKPPTQNSNKDGTSNNGNANRRTSITQSQNVTNNSPSTRPGARRRESGGDLLQNPLVSPTSNNRFSRDEPNISSPSSSLLRRKTDLRESFGPSLEDREKEGNGPSIATASPFGSMRRTSTQPVSAGTNGPSSPWSGAPPSAGFSPMGAFGNFTIGSGSIQTPTADEKKSGFGSVRGQSRFKGLMGAGSSVETAAKVKEKASVNSLERLTESRNEPTQAQWANDRTAMSNHQITDFYGDEEDFGTGSAALGGDDASPPLPQSSRYRNPDRQRSYDEIGFSSLGQSSDMPPFRELMQRRDYAQQQTPQTHHLGMGHSNEPMSPTNTNPYQSPEGEKAVPEDNSTDESDLHSSHYPGSGPFGQTPRGFHNQLDEHSGDRSQTSSTGAARGFPSLGGLGDLGSLSGSGPWSAAPGAIGTPSRAQPGFGAPFGDSSFGPFGDTSSRSQSVIAGSTLFGSTPTGTVNRNSKLGSLLPIAMQDQMRGEALKHEQGFGDGSDAFLRESGHHAPGFGLRDIDTSSRLGRGGPEDVFGNLENRGRGMQALASPFATNEPIQIPLSQASMPSSAQASFSAGPNGGNYFGRPGEQDTISSQMPASQQRQMVMPDRMRWIYRDPTGNTQGPWSGLEMHDWYKAGFFSPELQVKKLEDADYEPLAQLIRRIGNSREPFLVPQIGIAHGSSAAIPSSTTATAGAVPATTPSAAQPPFASSFPSFGTTLSADQQNALERRKQEEQYLMARQKEHLAQQQVMLKQMQHMGGVHGQQLHHHSSAHSLQSQPSYGSITSPSAPIGYQPSPGQGPIQQPGNVSGFFDGLSRNAGPLGTGADPLSSVREEDLPRLMERLAMGRGSQLPYGDSVFTQDQGHQQHVAAMLQERDRQRREQEQYDLLQRGNDDQRTTAERLEQYHQLRAQEDQQQLQAPGPIGGQVNRQMLDLDLASQQMHDVDHKYQDLSDQAHNEPEPLSLSEQVQKAAAKQQPASQPQSPWAKVDSGLPQPFPPPQSSSPMPAPTPQRNRQSVADALNAESQTPSQADSVETLGAALAPWAKEPAEGSKGPSLKEIQAMEAKNAAQREENAATARRALAEQERLTQQNQPVAPAPGLPSSANWASSISPAVPTTTGASPWTKPAVGKPAVATPVAGSKKTLAQIQKEEEARKNRAAAAAAANAAASAPTTAALAGGKRYAELASKASVPTPLTSSAAWTTVGASGKLKTPTAPAPSLSARTASGGIVQPSTSAAKPKPIVTTSTKGPANQQLANQEFQRWTKSALGKGLNPNMNVDEFVSQLFVLPPEADIISDSIYASSQTLDGRRFAEEFIRRRKLADRGIIPDTASTPGFSSPMTTSENKSGGGWSEVAKKGPQAAKEETNSAFKVVAGKKKAGKK